MALLLAPDASGPSSAENARATCTTCHQLKTAGLARGAQKRPSLAARRLGVPTKRRYPVRIGLPSISGPASNSPEGIAMPADTPNTSAPEAVQQAGRLRLLGAAMVLALLGQLLVGMANTFWLSLPDSGSGWSAASPASLLNAHMTLGTVVLVLAVWIAVLAVRRRDRAWVVASVVGIVAILVSFAAGMLFMGETSNDSASFLMAVGCAVAIAAYALALYRVPQAPRSAA
jgi:hypothetical protein